MKEVKKQHSQEVKKIFLLNHIISELSNNKTPSQIASDLGESKQKISYYIRGLKKQGVIQKLGYGVWKVNKEVKKSTKDTIPLQVKNVRGHAFIWKIRMPKIPDWWMKRKKVLEKKNIKFIEVGIKQTPRIMQNNRKIWLGNRGLVVYEPKGASFFAEDSINSKKLAVYTLLETLREVEEKLGINLQPYTFTTSREHYALIKNILAIQCNKEGEKVHIYDGSGRWLMIDNSLGEGGELENEGRDALPTNKKMQKWWNDHKKHNFEVTPEFVLNGLNQTNEAVHSLIIQQQSLPVVIGKLEQQISSHLALIQEYRKENIAWRRATKKKYRKHQEQTSLDKFI